MCIFRWCATHTVDSHPHQTLREFVVAWVEHQQYWHSRESRLVTYRFEDLLAETRDTLSSILRCSGLWNYFEITDKSDVASHIFIVVIILN